MLALQNGHGIPSPQISQQPEQERVKVIGKNFGFAIWTDQLRLRFAKLLLCVDNLALLFCGNIDRWNFAALCHGRASEYGCAVHGAY
jgi:hypothetical protein